jgi:hypothetical protein
LTQPEEFIDLYVDPGTGILPSLVGAATQIDLALLIAMFDRITNPR